MCPDLKRNDASIPQSTRDFNQECLPLKGDLLGHFPESRASSDENIWHSSSGSFQEAIRSASVHKRSTELPVNVELTRHSSYADSEHPQQSRAMDGSTDVQTRQGSLENEGLEDFFGRANEREKGEQTLYGWQDKSLTNDDSAGFMTTEHSGQGARSELEILFGGSRDGIRGEPLMSGKEQTRCPGYSTVSDNSLPDTRLDQADHGDIVLSTQLSDNTRGQFNKVQSNRAPCDVTRRAEQKRPGVQGFSPPPRRQDWRKLVNEDLQRCILGEQVCRRNAMNHLREKDIRAGSVCIVSVAAFVGFVKQCGIE